MSSSDVLDSPRAEYEGLRIAVVMPAYNEAALLPDAIRAVPAFVSRIVVVDDASTDATSEAARGTGDARVEVVRHAENRGVGAAIATGYARAFAAGADVAVVMAGDAQMHPDDVPALVDATLRGADYAKGNRLGYDGARGRMPLQRFVGNHVLSGLTRAMLGVTTRDSQCGFTALTRRGFERLRLDTLWPRYGYPNDLLAMASDAGLVVDEVVVRPVYGTEKSGIGWKHALFVIPYVLVRARLRRGERRVALLAES